MPNSTFNIWMNATLRYRYAVFPNIKLKLKKKPMGRMARMYVSVVMFIFFRPSRRVVVRDRSWVMHVAKNMCHVVSTIAASWSIPAFLSVSKCLTESYCQLVATFVHFPQWGLTETQSVQ
jgi:hypothetical protein